MSEKILSCGIKRERGWFYYLDENLRVYRAKMVSGGQKKDPASKPELILETNIKRLPEHLYYVDKKGDISCVPASRGGKALKGKKRRRTPAQKERLREKLAALKLKKTLAKKARKLKEEARKQKVLDKIKKQIETLRAQYSDVKKSKIKQRKARKSKV